MKFDTKLILREPEAHTGSVVAPVFLSSTFVQRSPGETYAEYEYSRGSNPTRKRLEDTFAKIENGNFGFAFGSGMAAIDSVLKLLNPGDEILAGKDLYGALTGYSLISFKNTGLSSPLRILRI